MFLTVAAIDVHDSLMKLLETTFTDGVWENFDLTKISSFVLACIGAVILFVFFWWGIRKLTRMAMAAFRRGKLSV